MQNKIEKMFKEWAENHDHSDGLYQVHAYLMNAVEKNYEWVDFKAWRFHRNIIQQSVAGEGHINREAMYESLQYIEDLMLKYDILRKGS